MAWQPQPAGGHGSAAAARRDFNRLYLFRSNRRLGVATRCRRQCPQHPIS